MFVIKTTRRKAFIRPGLMLALALLASESRAQSPALANAGGQDRVAALKESIAQNQAALKTYKWTETTEISLKGEVKKREQKECRYGPDGKVEKTPVPGAVNHARLNRAFSRSSVFFRRVSSRCIS